MDAREAGECLYPSALESPDAGRDVMREQHFRQVAAKTRV